MRVGVIDYGVGNLGSVLRALEQLRVVPVLVTCPTDINATDSLILPGVGNFSDCARLLNEGGWSQALRDEVQGGHKPLLGVCVGMQLLASRSMEGADANSPSGTEGLGFIPGQVEHLRTLGSSLRVPHVGWNEVTTCGDQGGLFDGIPDGTDFYFVHSYAFVPEDPADVLAITDYDMPVTAAVRRGHVWGTQFHPEKSSRAGFRLLRNFIEGRPC
jgi:imidazole glycerol-phosphate synthase subunit HisH